MKEPESCDCCVEKDESHPLWDEGKCVKCAAVTSPDGIGFYYDVEYKYGFCCPGEIDENALTPEYLKSIEWAFNDESQILEVRRLIKAYKDMIGSYREEKERCDVQCLGVGKGSCEEEKAKHCLLLRQYEEIIEMIKQEAEELIPMTGVGCEGKVDEEGNPACCQLIDGLYSCGPCKVTTGEKKDSTKSGSSHKRSRMGYRVNQSGAGGQTSALATPTIGKIAQEEALEEEYVRKMGPTCLDDLSCYLRHSLESCPEDMPHYSFELGKCVSCQLGVACPLERPYHKDGICVECLSDVECAYTIEGAQSPDKPYCVKNECVGCRADEDCGEGKTCQGGKCEIRDCREQGGCSGDHPYCDEGSGQCVMCQADKDCISGKCLDGKCGECTEDKECMEGLYCIGGRCERCREDLDCGEGRYCQEHRCIECRDNSDCKDSESPLCDYISGVCVSCPLELPNWDKEKGVCYGCSGGCRSGCYCDEACGTCHAEGGLKEEIKKYPKTPEQEVNELMWGRYKELLGDQLNATETSRLKESFMTALQEEEGNKVMKEVFPYNCAKGIEVREGQGMRYDGIRGELMLGRESLSNRYHNPEGMSEEIVRSMRSCGQGEGDKRYYQCRVDMPSSSWKALVELMRYKQHMKMLEEGGTSSSEDYRSLKEDLGARGAYIRYTRYVTGGGCNCGRESEEHFRGDEDEVWDYIKKVCLGEEKALSDVIMGYYTRESLPGNNLDIFLTLPDDIHAAFLDKAISCKKECDLQELRAIGNQ